MRWTKDNILGAIADWVAAEGALPVVLDWAPHLAR